MTVVDKKKGQKNAETPEASFAGQGQEFTGGKQEQIRRMKLSMFSTFNTGNESVKVLHANMQKLLAGLKGSIPETTVEHLIGGHGVVEKLLKGVNFLTVTMKTGGKKLRHVIIVSDTVPKFEPADVRVGDNERLEYQRQPIDVYEQITRSTLSADGVILVGNYLTEETPEMLESEETAVFLLSRAIDNIMAASGTFHSEIDMKDFANWDVNANFTVCPGAKIENEFGRPTSVDLMVKLVASRSADSRREVHQTGDIIPLAFAGGIVDVEFTPTAEAWDACVRNVPQRNPMPSPAYIPSVIMTTWGAAAPDNSTASPADHTCLLAGIVTLAKAVEGNGYLNVFSTMSGNKTSLGVLGLEWDPEAYLNEDRLQKLFERNVVPGYNNTGKDTTTAYNMEPAFFHHGKKRFYLDITLGSDNAWMAEPLLNMVRNDSSSETVSAAINFMTAKANALTNNVFGKLISENSIIIGKEFFIAGAPIIIESATMVGKHGEIEDVRSFDNLSAIHTWESMPESRNIFRNGMLARTCNLETRIRRQQLLKKVLPQYTANGTIVRLELGNQFISVLGASMNRAMNGKIGITGLQATTAQTVNYYDQHAVSDFNTGIVSGNGDSRAPNTFTY